MKILVIGSSNTDLVAKASHLPKPGETVLGGGFSVNPGGKGANQAVAAARLGGEVTFLCKLGEDDFGRQAEQLFRRERMDTRYVLKTPEHPSGVALIFVDEAAENSIVVASGANMALSPADVDRIGRFEDYGVVVTQLESPLETVFHAAEKTHAAGNIFILNPAPAMDLPEEIFPLVGIFTPNETEAGRYTGIEVKDEASAVEAAKILRAKGVRKVIITLGVKGSLVFSDTVCRVVPAYRVKAVDTTAAGDVFNGALAVRLAEGASLPDAARFATAAAAISVTRMGAQPSVPTRAETDDFLRGTRPESINP